MNKEDKNYVCATVENEGFDYAFVHYSDYENIEDEEFHKLRKEFLEARERLKEYIGKYEE